MLAVWLFEAKYMERSSCPSLHWDCDNTEHRCNEGTAQGALSDGRDERGVDFIWDRDEMSKPLIGDDVGGRLCARHCPGKPESMGGALG